MGKADQTLESNIVNGKNKFLCYPNSVGIISILLSYAHSLESMNMSEEYDRKRERDDNLFHFL